MSDNTPDEWQDQANLTPINGWRVVRAVSLGETGVQEFAHVTLGIQPDDDTTDDEPVGALDFAMSLDTAGRLAVDLLRAVIEGEPNP